MKPVAFVCYLPTHFVELRRLALALLRHPEKGLTPIVSFARPYPGREQNEAFCDEHGIRWRHDPIEPDTTPPAAVTTAAPRPAAPSRPRLTLRLAKLLPMPVRILVRLVIAYRRARVLARRRSSAARAMLDATGARLVVIAEDNLDYGTPFLVKLAHERGVKVMVLPYTVANELEFAEAFFDDEMRRVNRTNRWFARRHPRWVYEHRGRALLRSPLPVALLAERLDVAPPKPWILNSGGTDAIAVESDGMLEHYLRCGLPREQLVLTGSLSDDALAARLADAPRARAALVEDLGLPGKKHLVVTGLSPDQVKDRPPGLLEFADYPSLVRAWIGTLTSLPDTNVVVSLHPSTPVTSVAFLEDLGARIARGRDVATLVPLCDFYVAGASATIRLAVGCGKPVVNFDAYRFRYDDYTKIPGVLPAETLRDFQATARRLVEDRAFFAEVAAKQAEYARRWGMLDGRSTARILDLVSQLAGP